MFFPDKRCSRPSKLAKPCPENWPNLAHGKSVLAPRTALSKNWSMLENWALQFSHSGKGSARNAHWQIPSKDSFDFNSMPMSGSPPCMTALVYRQINLNCSTKLSRGKPKADEGASQSLTYNQTHNVSHIVRAVKLLRARYRPFYAGVYRSLVLGYYQTPHRFGVVLATQTGN